MINRIAKAPAKNGAKPRMAEISPGVYVQLDLKFMPSDVVFCDLVETGPGTFKLSPRTWERLVRVDSDLCERLGLGAGTQIMRRLIRSGFVDGGRTAPKAYTVNLSSYFRHLARCSEDPDFWANKGREKLFRSAMF